ncbi:MAG: hypothetical protein M1823_005573 [Watsoniomyces obsoletus]|nr:MAG: hypothetical protein M1823_005573 [Watsoniomyces obsoletus]
MTMASEEPAISPISITTHVGPHTSHVQVATPYIFQDKIDEFFESPRVNPVKEDTFRLQGVTWIDNVRKALRLPVRTFNTAVIYYHKFRLGHPDHEYNYIDAAAAALFTACKIEDTLKKSKDILCAAYNMKLPPAEHLSADDPIFEPHSKTIIGLERLMLESSGFDFRCRHPQKVLIKLAKHGHVPRHTVAKTAFVISNDIYRTFIPIKQSSSTMALACLELALRIHQINPEDVLEGGDYPKWSTNREEVMESLLDLLDLYTHHRTSTSLGPQYAIDTFLNIRITLNQESSRNEYPRYTQSNSNGDRRRRKHLTNGDGDHMENDEREMSPSKRRRKDGGGSGGMTGGDNKEKTISPNSPASTGSTLSRPRRSDHHHHHHRGRDGTIRFMLDPERERGEKEIVGEYFKFEEEEYEIVDDDCHHNAHGGAVGGGGGSDGRSGGGGGGVGGAVGDDGNEWGNSSPEGHRRG